MTLYRVTAHGQLIGSTSLEWQDVDMAVAFGEFSPLAGYESVRDTFRLFTAALSERNGQAETRRSWLSTTEHVTHSIWDLRRK
jgi:hypothetical protein